MAYVPFCLDYLVVMCRLLFLPTNQLYRSFLYMQFGTRESFKRDTAYLAAARATKGTGEGFSQYKSDTAFCSNLSRRRYLMIFPGLGKKKTNKKCAVGNTNSVLRTIESLVRVLRTL